jgi:hypothetical protein
MLSPLVQYLFDAVFLAEAVPAPHKLDLHSILDGDALHVGPKLVAHRLGPLGVVEHPDLMLVKEAGHPGRVTPPRYRSLDDNPVIAAENSGDLIPVPLS